MKVIKSYDTIPPPQVVIALPAILPPSLVFSLSPIFNSQDLFPSKEISPKDTETHVESPILVPSSSAEGSSLPVKSTIPDYLFDEHIFAELDNLLWIISRPLGSKPPPKRTSKSTTPAMTEATIRKLITEGVAATLEAQAAAMENVDNPNTNTGPREIPVVKKETTKSSLTVNLSTLMVQKELLDLFAGSGPTWLFDIDTLTQSMNYQLVVVVNQPISIAGIQANLDADPQNTDADAALDDKENKSEVHVTPSSGDKIKKHDEKAKGEAKGNSHVDLYMGVRYLSDEFEEFSVNSTNRVNAASAPVIVVGPNSTNSTNSFNAAGPSNTVVSSNFEIGGKSSFVDPSQYPDDLNMPALEDIIYSDDEEDVGSQADFSNLDTSITISPIPTTRVHKDHLVTQIISDLPSEEPKRVHQALKDPSWIEAMQEELFKFNMQKVWVLVDLSKGKRAIGLKWVFRNKKDERGIVIRNKPHLVSQGHTQEEGIDYEEVFASVARIEAIRLFLAYASFMGFMVYQMDVKSDFLYGTIKEEVYVCQPPRFEDPGYPDKVYKEVKALYGLHQAPIACQDKYVAKILRKFGLTDGKSASTLTDTVKPLLKDPDGEDVDVHIYKLMIGSLMYLTLSRPDIMFAVCACAYFQDSPFKLVAYSDSDYARESLDRKSTTGGCQFLSCRFISWQCKKQTVVATSSTETEYVAAASYYAQEWILLYLMVCWCNNKFRMLKMLQKMRMMIMKYLLNLLYLYPHLLRHHNHLLKTYSITTSSSNCSSPPSPQPLQTTDISMTLLNTMLETCATLTKQVANLEQDKIAQAIEITKLKQRVKRVESSADTVMDDQEDASKKGVKIAELDADEDVTLHDAEVAMDADIQGSVHDTNKAEPVKVEEVIEVVTAAKLMTEVVITTVAQVPKASALRRRRGVVIQHPEETATASDKAFARELNAELNANIKWNDVMEQVKRKEKQDNTERVEEEVIGQKEEGNKRKGKNLNQYAAKKQRIDEEMILLVEKKYPLTRFTLEKMLSNVRLEVEEESKMSLELLRPLILFTLRRSAAYMGRYQLFQRSIGSCKDPMERSFDDYKWVFDHEIEQLVDEYELGIGKNSHHILEMIWENCKNIQGKAKEWLYDYWLEEDEKQENRDKKYDPPMVHLETFEVTR
uniref:Copia protein n=1 Tax=Tanacetum cinerariifolium TaxID=118510 RepID=A0A6L2JI07_TANCI|nr:copia protein [Tanacetum cinerariifolium]